MLVALAPRSGARARILALALGPREVFLGLGERGLRLLEGLRRVFQSRGVDSPRVLAAKPDALVGESFRFSRLRASSFYKAQKAWDALDVGGVVTGDVPSWRVDHMRYGGVKESGLGREGVKFAIEDMTEVRRMVIRHPRG